jgi:hypothetical protein
MGVEPVTGGPKLVGLGAGGSGAGRPGAGGTEAGGQGLVGQRLEGQGLVGQRLEGRGLVGQGARGWRARGWWDRGVRGWRARGWEGCRVRGWMISGCGGSVVAHQTVVLRSRVSSRHLPTLWLTVVSRRVPTALVLGRCLSSAGQQRIHEKDPRFTERKKNKVSGSKARG